MLPTPNTAAYVAALVTNPLFPGMSTTEINEYLTTPNKENTTMSNSNDIRTAVLDYLGFNGHSVEERNDLIEYVNDHTDADWDLLKVTRELTVTFSVVATYRVEMDPSVSTFDAGDIAEAIEEELGDLAGDVDLMSSSSFDVEVEDIEGNW